MMYFYYAEFLTKIQKADNLQQLLLPPQRRMQCFLASGLFFVCLLAQVVPYSKCYGMNFRKFWEGNWDRPCSSGGSRGPGAMPPPVGGLKFFFRQYINIITKPTAYDGPWE